MKKVKWFILMLLIIPLISLAGEIYGTIKGDDGKPLTNQVVQIKQNDKLIASDTTDANGYFSVTVKEVGKLKLELEAYKGATFDVFSSNSSSRYNLSLSKTGDKWLLKSL